MSRTSPEAACHPGGDTHPSICVLGIGNLLWADEGFGVRCVEALQQRHEFAPHVSLVDGGTQGLYLIQHVQAADCLLILDAIDYGLAPGTLMLVRDDEVPRFLGTKKMSLHQTGFQEVLSLAQLTGHYPAQVLLIGCSRRSWRTTAAACARRSKPRWTRPWRWAWPRSRAGAAGLRRAASP